VQAIGPLVISAHVDVAIAQVDLEIGRNIIGDARHHSPGEIIRSRVRSESLAESDVGERSEAMEGDANAAADIRRYATPRAQIEIGVAQPRYSPVRSTRNQFVNW